MRRILTGLIALGFLAALPAVAGEKKCQYNTQECLNQMAAKLKKTGWLGVELDYDKELKAALIREVIPDSPAEEAGLKSGDIFHALNGIPYDPYDQANKEAFGAEWEKQGPGKEITLTIRRDGKPMEVRMKMGTVPADVLARWIGKHMMEHAEAQAAAK